MPDFGKPNATGRSSGKLSGRERKLRSPPTGEPWAWLTRELLASPAIQGLSLSGRRLLDFLLIEHTNHAGAENGFLIATYDQLAKFGLRRNSIPTAISELAFMGLIRVERGYSLRGSKKSPNLFRLTFYSSKGGSPPTHEWKGKTIEAVNVWKSDRSMIKKHRPHRVDIEVDPISGGGQLANVVRIK